MGGAVLRGPRIRAAGVHSRGREALADRESSSTPAIDDLDCLLHRTAILAIGQRPSQCRDMHLESGILDDAGSDLRDQFLLAKDSPRRPNRTFLRHRILPQRAHPTASAVFRNFTDDGVPGLSGLAPVALI